MRLGGRADALPAFRLIDVLRCARRSGARVSHRRVWAAQRARQHVRRHPAHQFTYEVRTLADDAGSAPRYEVRFSNATTDQRFALSYRDDTAATGFLTDGAITLVDAAGPGTLRHSSFTTF